MDELVLPAFFTDNYFTLLPGDIKKIELDLSSTNNKSNNEGMKLVVEGWNVLKAETKF